MGHALEHRLADVVREYDEQGNHRTGTAVDAASLDWLAARVAASGLEPRFETFQLSRVDVRASYLRIAHRRIGGVPLFDGSFTPPDGVAGSLGLFGTSSDIGLACIGKAVPAEWGHEQRPSTSQIRASRHKAIVLVTYGDRSGLVLQNASRFTAPGGPPVIQVSSTEGAWLHAQARTGQAATVVLDVARTATGSSNLLVEMPGARTDLRPVVITTPRTGWWQCAGERGGGLACWLEVMSALAAADRRRAVYFAAFAGHELGLLGGEAFASRSPERWTGARQWLHFGANIGVAGHAFRVQGSEDGCAQQLIDAFAAEGEMAVERAPAGMTPRGEAVMPYRAGVPYVAPICGSDVFHHPSDRWPDVVDIAAVARCARACVSLCLRIAAEDVEQD